jgi:hypothetical protein
MRSGTDTGHSTVDDKEALTIALSKASLLSHLQTLRFRQLNQRLYATVKNCRLGRVR